LTPSNYFEMAAALGLKYVEVPLYSFSLHEWYGSREQVAAVAEAARVAGVKIVSGVAHSNIGGCVQGDEIARDGVHLAKAEARRAIEVGASLGTEVIRLTEPGDLEPDQVNLEQEYVQSYGQALRELGDYAAQYGIRVTIENTALSSARIKRIVDAADHPAVGALYDPCNFYRHGEDPLTALKNLGQRIMYCHLKDAWFPYPAQVPDTQPAMSFSGQMLPWWWITPLGKGNIDWGSIFSELATFYHGYMCLEHDIRDSVMWVTRLGIAYVRHVATEYDLDIEV